MIATTEDMDLVGHLCLMPDSNDHLWEVTSRWLAGGLERGERVMHFEDGTAERLLDRLADDGVPFRPALTTGQFVIVPGEQTRDALCNGVERLEQVARAAIDQTAADGWPGLRLSGENHCVLERCGLPALVDHELTLDRVLRESPTTRLLCRFGLGRYDDSAVDAMRAVHHTELVTPAVYDDTLLRVTTTGPASVRLAGEVDHSNRPEIGRVLAATLDAALRSPESPTDIVLDLASLRFLDVAGAVQLVRASESFPVSHRLVLLGVRPRVARVLDRCGAPFAPRLAVRLRETEEPAPVESPE